MTVIKFSGLVELGDDCRVAYEGELDGSVHIGGRDVVEEVGQTQWSGPVTVGIADERYTGDLLVDLGWGYSEYTPMDPDMLTVGPHDLIAILLGHEGEQVTVWIADEPVDLAGINLEETTP